MYILIYIKFTLNKYNKESYTINILDIYLNMDLVHNNHILKYCTTP